jgi:hypothetical protein
MSRNPSFTKAQVRRAVKAAESAGLPVNRVRVYPDGSIEVMAGETASVPVDSQKASLAASWDDA